MRFVRGRVLDLGCGAGRVGLHLQSRGHDVVGIDVSPLAVEIAGQRGLADVRLGTLDGAVSWPHSSFHRFRMPERSSAPNQRQQLSADRQQCQAVRAPDIEPGSAHSNKF